MKDIPNKKEFVHSNSDFQKSSLAETIRQTAQNIAEAVRQNGELLAQAVEAVSTLPSLSSFSSETIQASGGGTENTYLSFGVGGGTYCIEIKYVMQIVMMQQVTEMPEMPPTMKGVINLRGNVIPVISLRLRFGKAEDGYTGYTCIVIVRVDEQETGLIVDAIKETVSIEPENVSPMPNTKGGADDTYITGVARLENGGNAMLVDLQKLFASHIAN